MVLPQTPNAPTQPDRLLPNQGLLVNQSIVSLDGRFTMTMRPDGTLVLYGPQNQTMLWASATSGCSNVFDVIMQASDGNLVIYDNTNTLCWASNTGGSPGAILILHNDGNAVI